MCEFSSVWIFGCFRGNLRRLWPFPPGSLGQHFRSLGSNIRAVIIRIGFWGISYCNQNKEPPKQYRPSFRAPILLPSSAAEAFVGSLPPRKAPANEAVLVDDVDLTGAKPKP